MKREVIPGRIYRKSEVHELKILEFIEVGILYCFPKLYAISLSESHDLFIDEDFFTKRERLEPKIRLNL